MIKQKIRLIVSKYVSGAEFDILTPPDSSLGDYSINAAFVIAKFEKRNPKEVGEELAEKLMADEQLSEMFEKIEFVAPGYVNFHLKKYFLYNQLMEIIASKSRFEYPDVEAKKINLEYVSANPSGPLTVGNARAAAYGDTLGNILREVGREVIKEYYINDAGTQAELLGESVAKRLQEIWGETPKFGAELYQGKYIIEIAEEIDKKKIVEPTIHFRDLVEPCKEYAIKAMVQRAKDSLETLGAVFDVWFSEKSLHDGGEVEETLKILKNKGYTYEKDGAVWLKVREILGLPPAEDENEEDIKDAVLIRKTGTPTYLMGDLAYTRSKLETRDPPAGGLADRAINIWGTDHHGDVPRLMAGAKALGFENRLQIILHQLVLIKQSDQYKRMSKRKGEFVELDEFVREVGKDAIRYFFLVKDLDTHMEFDVDLAKEQSSKNPVYYIQYATARLASIFQKTSSLRSQAPKLDLLSKSEELAILGKLVKLPDLLLEISQNYQVHHLAQYTYELANLFHKFYEECRIIGEEKSVQETRLALAKGVREVLAFCLDLMGISAPTKM